jgi:hypothetical protein
MKKVILILVAAAVLFSGADLQAAKKAGEVIGDSIFHDLQYGYTLKIPPGWEAAKIEKEKKILRVIITKKSPVVPAQFSQDQSFFTEPSLIILADSNESSDDDILALLKAQKRSGELLKTALKNFTLVTYSEYTPEFTSPRKFKIGGYEGLFVDLRKEYRYNITVQGQARPLFVQNYLRGRVYILKDGPMTLLIQQIAEKDRYGFNEREFEAMIRSLDSGKPKDIDKQTMDEKPEDIMEPKDIKDEKKD